MHQSVATRTEEEHRYKGSRRVPAGAYVPTIWLAAFRGRWRILPDMRYLNGACGRLFLAPLWGPERSPFGAPGNGF